MEDIYIKNLDTFCSVGIAAGIVLIIVSVIVFCTCSEHFCTDPDDKYYGKNKPASNVKVKVICGSAMLVVGVAVLVVSCYFNSNRLKLRWDYAIEHDYRFYKNSYLHEISKEELAALEKYVGGNFDGVGMTYDDDKKTVIVDFNGFSKSGRILDDIEDVIDYYKNGGK